MPYEEYLKNIQGEKLPYMEDAPPEPIEAIDEDPDMERSKPDWIDKATEVATIGSDVMDFASSFSQEQNLGQRSYTAYNMPSNLDLEGARQSVKDQPGALGGALEYGAKGAEIGGKIGSLIPGGGLIGSGIGALAGGIAGAIKGGKEKRTAEMAADDIQVQREMENQRYRESEMSSELNRARTASIYGSSSTNLGYSIYM